MPRQARVVLEAEALRKLRRASATGRPLGSAAWVKALEAATGRRLADPPLGRPRAELTPTRDGEAILL